MHSYLRKDALQKLIDSGEIIPLKAYFEMKYKDSSFIQQVEELMEEIKKDNLRKVINGGNANIKPTSTIDKVTHFVGNLTGEGYYDSRCRLDDNGDLYICTEENSDKNRLMTSMYIGTVIMDYYYTLTRYHEEYRRAGKTTITDTQYDLLKEKFESLLSDIFIDPKHLEQVVSMLKLDYDLIDHRVSSNGDVHIPLPAREALGSKRVLFPSLLSMPACVITSEKKLKEKIKNYLKRFKPDSFIKVSPKIDGIAIQVQFRMDFSEIIACTKYRKYIGSVFAKLGEDEDSRVTYSSNQQKFLHDFRNFMEKDPGYILQKTLRPKNCRDWIIVNLELSFIRESKAWSRDEDVFFTGNGSTYMYYNRAAVAGLVAERDGPCSYLLTALSHFYFYIYGAYEFVEGSEEARKTYENLLCSDSPSSKFSSLKEIYKSSSSFVKPIESWMVKKPIINLPCISDFGYIVYPQVNLENNKTTLSFDRIRAGDEKAIDVIYTFMCECSEKMKHYKTYPIVEDNLPVPSDGIVFSGELLDEGSKFTDSDDLSNFAIKFNSGMKSVTIDKIVKNVSDKGRVTYVAHFKPVDMQDHRGIDIGMFSKAVIYNNSNVESGNLKKGSSVILCLSGMLIPVLYADESSTKVL